MYEIGLRYIDPQNDLNFTSNDVKSSPFSQNFLHLLSPRGLLLKAPLLRRWKERCILGALGWAEDAQGLAKLGWQQVSGLSNT